MEIKCAFAALSRLQFRLQAGSKSNQVVTYGSGFCDRILERDVGDLCAAKHDQPAKLALVHQIDGSRSIAGGEHTVIGGRRASALGMSQVHRARFISGFFLDQFCDGLTDAAEAGVTEGVQLRPLG